MLVEHFRFGVFQKGMNGYEDFNECHCRSFACRGRLLCHHVHGR